MAGPYCGYLYFNVANVGIWITVAHAQIARCRDQRDAPAMRPVFAFVLALISVSALADESSDPDELLAPRAGSRGAPPDPPPPSRALVLSARICLRQVERAAALEAIREERRYSRIGGAINLGLIWRQQAAIKFYDAVIAKSRQAARRERLALVSCRAPQIRELLACAAGRGTCDPHLQDLIFSNDEGVRGAL